MTAASHSASAELYRFVDESGLWRTSSELPDERYVVFQKVPPPVEVPPAQEEAAPDLLAFPPDSASLAERRTRYASLIGQAAREESVDAALLHAVITVESGYNVKAKSPKGASGLMQLMPGTAAQYGATDIWDPLQNLRAGARYLRAMIGTFKDIRLALAAYNAGQGAVLGAGNKIPPYAETQSYVPKVLQFYARYRGVN